MTRSLFRQGTHDATRRGAAACRPARCRAPRGLRPGDADAAQAAQRRRPDERRGDVGHQASRAALRRRVGHPGGHADRDPPLGRDEPPAGAAPRRQPAGRTARVAHVGHQRPWLQHRSGEQAAGDDRRAHGLHAALLRRLLGGAGHAAGRHRSHRGHQRTGRHDVGRQRRQRRDQHHHAQRGGHAGALRGGRRWLDAARVRGTSLRRLPRLRHRLPRLCKA